MMNRCADRAPDNGRSGLSRAYRAIYIVARVGSGDVISIEEVTKHAY